MSMQSFIDLPADCDQSTNDGREHPPHQKCHESTIGAQRSLGDRKSGYFLSTMSLVNCVVGAGVIGVPGALEATGFSGGIALTILFCLVIWYTIELVVRTADSATNRGLLPCSTYEALGQLAFGHRGRVTVIVFQFLFAFGGNIAYIKVIEDLVSNALYAATGNDVFVDFEVWITFGVCTLVVLPLFSMRTMGQLDRVSTLSTVVVVTVVMIMVHQLATRRKVLCNGCSYEYRAPVFKPGLLRVLGVYVFAFTCNHTQFFVARDFADFTPDRWSRVVRAALSFSCVVTLTTGVVVYSIFGSNTEGDMFLSFPDMHESGFDIVVAAKLLMAGQICCTYPVVGLVAREMIQVLWKMFQRRWRDHQYATENGDAGGSEGYVELSGDSAIDASTPQPGMTTLSKNQAREASAVLHWFTTLSLWGLSVALALSAPELNDVLNVSGGIAGTGIAFLLPCAFALKVEARPWGGRCLAWLVLIFGTSAGVATTIATIVFLVTG